MDWKKIKARFDSKCITCEQTTNMGFDVLWKKGVGVIHPECNKPDEVTELKPKSFCHECDKQCVNCGDLDCMLCKFGNSFCPSCQTHVSVNRK